jgi:hypothetical protein
MSFLSRRIVLPVVLALAAGMAAACECDVSARDTSNFLHVPKDGKLTLPANALGVLFHETRASTLWKVRASDNLGNRILDAIPAPLPARAFDIFDETANRRVGAVLEPLDIEAQLGTPEWTFLSREQDRAAAPLGMDAHLLAGARRDDLRDISAAARASSGLFRVAPQGGFLAGHTYVFQYMPGLIPLVKVKVGPPLPQRAPGAIVLRGERPTREILSLPASGMCSQERAVMVQRVKYEVAPQRQAYRHLLMALTSQQYFGRDRDYVGLGSGTIVRASYRAEMCGAAIGYGASAVGAGQELVWADCPDLSSEPERRQVRGFAGILELDRQLQPSNTLEVPFAQAAGPYCWRLRAQVVIMDDIRHSDWQRRSRARE